MRNAPFAGASAPTRAALSASQAGQGYRQPSGPRSHPIGDFCQAIASSGLGDPDIIADGELHRFRAEDDKPGRRSGWYVLHLDRLPAGAFGSWKTGEVQTWSAKPREQMTARERADVRARIEQAKRQQRTERQRQQQTAAERAADIWDHCAPAPSNHPYLIAKGIEAHGARVDQRGYLVIHATDGERITTLQFIAANGTKRFLPGGRISGCWSLIQGEKAGPILIGEGFATLATLRQETRSPAVVAFNAGNLLPVANAIRRLHPHDEIILCGDDDRWTLGNPGATKARAAALAIGAKLVMPDFSGMDLSTRPTDWNDWSRLRRAGGRAMV